MTPAWPRLLLLALFASCAGAPARVAAEGLQPFQMVRSLQLVQDRIASGDHAALPMQRKLLEMIDKRFRVASVEELERRPNFRGLLVYGMSGGNPATLELALSKLLADNRDRLLGDGILSYLRGRPQHAKAALASIEPLKLEPELGAFLALVKGSLSAQEDPKAALALFDQARLLAPGSLVEEAALRRAILLHATRLEAEPFLRGSRDYVSRFLRSPYASQFADAFVSGVVDLHASVGFDHVEAIAALMEPEQEKVIYLRIARRAAIEGLEALSAFASAKVESLETEGGPPLDPRALLYASLSTVTSEPADEMLAKLKGIDRAQLSDGDRMLLDAVAAVAREISGPPESEAVSPPPMSEPGTAAGASDDARKTVAVPGAEAIHAQAEPAMETEADAADEKIAATRNALEEVDELLKAAAQ